RDLLVDFTTVLARLLTRHGNRVGATLYASRVERSIPARSGRIQVLRILNELEKRPRLQSAPLTSLSELLDAGVRGLKRRSLVFVVSDFFSAAGWEDGLERISRRHETLAIRLADPRTGGRSGPDGVRRWGLRHELHLAFGSAATRRRRRPRSALRACPAEAKPLRAPVREPLARSRSHWQRTRLAPPRSARALHPGA